MLLLRVAIEFKLLKSKGNNPSGQGRALSDMEWQPGQNLSITMPEHHVEAVEVTCSWGGGIEVLVPAAKTTLGTAEAGCLTTSVLSENTQTLMMLHQQDEAELSQLAGSHQGGEVELIGDSNTQDMLALPALLLANIVSAGGLLHSVKEMKDTVWASTVLMQACHDELTPHAPEQSMIPLLKEKVADDETAVPMKVVHCTSTKHMLQSEEVKDGGSVVATDHHTVSSASGNSAAVMLSGTSMMLVNGINSNPDKEDLPLKHEALMGVLSAVDLASNLTASFKASLIKMWR
jgi:hypothetical protein